MGDLYVIRHGETKLSSEQRIGGWLDVPLTPGGEQEAKAAADALRGQAIRRIYASDLQSAMEMAKIMSPILDASVQGIRALRSWNVGTLAGEPLLPHWEELVRYMTHPSDQPPGGESFIRYRNRVLDRMDYLFGLARDDTKSLVAVTHSRVLRLIEAWQNPGEKGGIDLDMALLTKKSSAVPVETGEGYRFVWTPDGWDRNTFTIGAAHDSRAV